VLVADLNPEDWTLRPDRYYLVEDGLGRAQLASGSQAQGARVLGPVLFVCRPPSRDAPQTSDLMSL
jgi:hypothetical protein